MVIVSNPGRYHSLIVAAVIAWSICTIAFVQAETSNIPRTTDGKPDLTGTWDNGSGIDFLNPQQLEGDSICVSGCTTPATTSTAARRERPKPDRPTYKSEFAAKVKDLEARQVETDPVLRCLPPGLPRIGPPDKIVKQDNLFVFLYEDVTGNYFRLIPVGATEFRDDVEETYLGDSIAHWDGDTLVIESTKFTDDTWLTDDGSFHTLDLRVEERITRKGDTIEWLATAYDPSVLAEPWALRPRTAELTDWEIVEAPPCIERDLEHVVDGTHHDNPR